MMLAMVIWDNWDNTWDTWVSLGIPNLRHVSLCLTCPFRNFFVTTIRRCYNSLLDFYRRGVAATHGLLKRLSFLYD